MGCPIKGCPDAHKNQWEHFNDPKRGVTNEVTTPKSVPNSVTNRQKEAVSTEKPVPNIPNRSEYQRVKAWKIANREKYNSKMKEVMRKKRAAKAEYIKTHLEMMEGGAK